MIDEDQMPRAASPLTEPEADGGWGGLVAVVVVLGWIAFSSLTLLAVVLSIIFFVFMHELGHYMTARWTGMKATEFFIGFGPRIWSFKRGETEFGLKPILAGAYVKIIGMNNLEDVDPREESRTYRYSTYPRKVLVITAGSVMHFIMAIILFFGYFAFVGEPEIVDETAWTITSATPGSAADEAGLLEGDEIISIAGVQIDVFDDLRNTVEPRAGESVPIVIEREGAQQTVTATLGTNPSDPDKGFLGVGSIYEVERQTEGIVAASGRAVTEFPDRVWDSLAGMGTFVSNIGGYLDNVFTAPGNQDQIDLETRPVSVVGVADISSQIGFDAVYFLAMFNVFVGVFNLLPLLPLDGGHLAVATYERVRTRRGERHVVDIAKLMPITYVVFFAMVLFGLGAVWLDIANPIEL